MDNILSPHVEQMIEHAISRGLFSSRTAVIEAGVERLLHEQPLSVPAEHLEAIEHALDELDAGLGVEWNVEDEIRRYRERRAERQPDKG